MSAAALELSGNAFQPVSIDYHAMMAKSLTIKRAVKAGGHYLKHLAVAKDFWALSWQFSDLLKHLDQLTSAPEQELAVLLTKLKELHQGIGEVVLMSKSKGLLNRSLTAPAIRAVMAKNEEFLDLIDAFEVSLNPSTRTDFEEALRELRAGETVSLESLHF